MDTCISHDTALCWLLANPNPLASGTGHRCSTQLPKKMPGTAIREELASSLRLSSSDPIDVLVSNKSSIARTPGFAGHLRSLGLPRGSLVELDGIRSGLATVSPELLFVQSAATHSLVDTIAIGCALCSRYRLEGPEANIVIRASKGDAPLTTKSKLEAYAKSVEALPGASRALRALPYVLDNSYSPMESGIALCLTLPLRYGGFGLGSAELNPCFNVRIGTGADGRGIYEERYPDIVLTALRRSGAQTRVAIDFDSDTYHLNSKTAKRDSERRNAFTASLGMPHLTISSAQAKDYVAFTKSIDTIRRVLGLRRMDFARGKANDAERLDQMRHRQFELWKRFVSSAAKTAGRDRLERPKNKDTSSEKNGG